MRHRKRKRMNTRQGAKGKPQKRGDKSKEKHANQKRKARTPWWLGESNLNHDW